MAQTINCNYSRCAIRSLSQRLINNSRRRLSQGELQVVMDEYNERFEGASLHMTPSLGNKRIRSLLLTFTRKWHPQNQKDMFLKVFSLSAWSHLPAEEKRKHQLTDCQECPKQHLSLTRAFPSRYKTKAVLHEKNPTITFEKHNLSSQQQCGRKVLTEMTAICQESFQKSFQEVIASTPNSKLMVKPSSQKIQSSRRQTIRNTKQTIQKSIDSTQTECVMGNRISWRKYDRMRKAGVLISPKASQSPITPSTPSRRHGSNSKLSSEQKDGLLSEAQEWSENEIVNWSKIARRYGLTNSNGGQTVKEFIRGKDIHFGIAKERNQSARRRRKRLSEGIPFPMPRPSTYHKKMLGDMVNSGEIAQGTNVVPTEITSFTFDKQSSTVTEITTTAHARKISLLEIRTNLLKRHEQMGLIRRYTVDESKTAQQLREELTQLGEHIDTSSSLETLQV